MRLIPHLMVILALPAVLAAAPAAAEDGKFVGPRIAAVGGYDSTDYAPGAGAQNGAIYGVQIGYDGQSGVLVYGVEADFTGASASTRLLALTSRADHFATAAVRIGVTPTNNTLLFARGGVANARLTLAPGGSIDRTGWTAGGGGEIALTDQFFIRAEYRYSDYGQRLRGQQLVGGVGIRF
jgi:outer membrane immunogenic protein